MTDISLRSLGRVRRLLRLALRPLLPHAHQPGIAPRIPQRPIHAPFLLGHLARLDRPDRLDLAPILDWQHGTQSLRGLARVLVRRDLLLGRVRGLVLAGAAREQDQARLVGFQSLHVHGEGFGREVGATRVHGDADRGGEFAGDAGFLEILARMLDE